MRKVVGLVSEDGFERYVFPISISPLYWSDQNKACHGISCVAFFLLAVREVLIPNKRWHSKVFIKVLKPTNKIYPCIEIWTQLWINRDHILVVFLCFLCFHLIWPDGLGLLPFLRQVAREVVEVLVRQFCLQLTWDNIWKQFTLLLKRIMQLDELLTLQLR